MSVQRYLFIFSMFEFLIRPALIRRGETQHANTTRCERKRCTERRFVVGRVNVKLANFPSANFSNPRACSVVAGGLKCSPREFSEDALSGKVPDRKQILSVRNGRSGELLQRLNARRARLFKRAPEISRVWESGVAARKIDGSTLDVVWDDGYIARQGKGACVGWRRSLRGERYRFQPVERERFKLGRRRR